MTDGVPQLRLNLQSQKPLDLTFDAPHVSSDGGLLLLRALDEQLQLTTTFARLLRDPRSPHTTQHDRLEQLRQRVYQIAMGYEDCNDANTLRRDPLLKIVCNRSTEPVVTLSSQPTLSRFEGAIDAASIQRVQQAFEQDYVASLPADTQCLVLDIDTTDDPTHGQQQLSFFHGYYDQHMLHPLLVFDGLSGALVTVLLRPGNAHASRSAWVTLRRVIHAIKARFPDAQILVRGDSGFCVPSLLERLERLDAQLGGIDYLFGLAKNARLLKLAEPAMQQAQRLYQSSGEHVRRFASFEYAAESWPHTRAVVLKAEHHHKGANPRFIVSSLRGARSADLYEGYCDRGQCENWIKDFKNAVKADRLSCTRFVSNAFRLWLHAMAYRLLHTLRTRLVALVPQPAPQLDTLRLRLLKVAAHVTESARRLLVRLPRSFPWANVFRRLLQWCQPPPLHAT